MRRLLTGLDRIGRREGSIVELAGEPGAGKTRLLNRLATESARRGVPVLRGSATAAQQHVPHYLINHALRNGPAGAAVIDRDEVLAVLRLLDGDARAEPATRHRECSPFSDVRALLRDWARTGLVMILDDLQWADEGSIAMIDHLIRWPVEAPLHLVLAHRPRQTSIALRGILARAAEADAVQRIELRPLSLQQYGELLHLPIGDPRLRDLHRAGEGVPLYGQVLAAGRDGVDAEGPFAARLIAETTGLTPDETRTLQAAAVLGTPFDLDTLSCVADLPVPRTADAADRLRRRDLLRAEPGTTELRLRHHLVGQLVHSTADLAWLTAAHRRAVTALARRGAPTTELAAHVERSPIDAGSADDLPVLVQAAQDALPDEPRQAVHWLRAALRRVPDDERRADRSLPLLTALLQLLSAGAQDDAPLLREIRSLLPGASPRVRRRAVACCAIRDAALGNTAGALAALAVAEPAPGTAGEAESLVDRCTVEFLAGGVPDAATADRALALAEEHDLVAVRATAMAMRALRLVSRGAPGCATSALDRAAALIDSLPDPVFAERPECLAVLGWADVVQLRFVEAERHLRRGIALSRTHGALHLLPVYLTGLGYTYEQTGRLIDATRTLTEARAALHHRSDDAQHALLLCLEWRNGLLTEALPDERQDAFDRLASSPDLPRGSRWGHIAALCLADAAMLSGDPDLSAALIIGAGGGPDLADLPWSLRSPAFETLTVAAGQSGTPAGRWAAPSESAACLPQHEGYALTARGHIARGRGDVAAAAEAYLEAANRFADSGMAGQQSRVLMRAAACAISADRLDQAEQALGTARQLSRVCGMTMVHRAALRQLDRVARLRADLRPEGPGIDLSTLTEREREVADAASTGKRTREIAEQLGLSPRTVDVHLTRIYRKLGIRSRAALTRLVVESA